MRHRLSYVRVQMVSREWSSTFPGSGQDTPSPLRILSHQTENGVGRREDGHNCLGNQLWCSRRICLRVQQVVCSSGCVGHGTVVCDNRESSVHIFVEYDAGDSEQFYGCGDDDNRVVGSGGGEDLVLHAGESNKVGADTETGTGAGGRANRGGIDIKDGEGGGRNEGDHSNLSILERLAGENKGGDGDGESLQNVLHEASDNVSHINSRGGGLRLRLHGLLNWSEDFFNRSESQNERPTDDRPQ
jgi:hypothetical protein